MNQTESRFDYDAFVQSLDTIPSEAGVAPKEAAPERPHVEPEDVKGALRILGNIACRAARVRELTETEAQEWAEGMAPFLDKYAGPWLADRGPELAAIVSTVQVVAPRYEEWRAARAKGEELRREWTDVEPMGGES